MVPYLENTVAHASILTILSISFERYYATCRPLEVLYRCTTRRTIKIIVAVWLCSLLSTSPFIFMSFLDDALFYDNTPIKVCRTPVDSVWKRIYVFSTIIVFFTLPLFALMVLYTLIAKQLKNSNAKSKEMIPSLSMLTRPSNHKSSKSRQQVICMLVVIIILFFLCLLPIRVVTLWYIYSSNDDKHSLGLEGFLNLLTFARIMLYANSAVNPLIYNIVSTKFRGAFMRTLGCRLSLVEMRRLSITGSYRSKVTYVSRAFNPNEYDRGNKNILIRCNTLP